MYRFVLSLSRIRESNNINLLCGFGPFRLSRAPSSLYLVVESLCLPRSRAPSYNAEAARWERGEGMWAFAIYWFKPFHLYLALAHATPHPRFSPASHFSSRVVRRRRRINSRGRRKKAGHLLSIKCPSIEAWWSRRKKGTEDLWLSSFRDSNVFSKYKRTTGALQLRRTYWRSPRVLVRYRWRETVPLKKHHANSSSRSFTRMERDLSPLNIANLLQLKVMFILFVPVFKYLILSIIDIAFVNVAIFKTFSRFNKLSLSAIFA